MSWRAAIAVALALALAAPLARAADAPDAGAPNDLAPAPAPNDLAPNDLAPNDHAPPPAPAASTPANAPPPARVPVSVSALPPVKASESPIYRKPWFWLSVVAGAAALSGLVYGAVWLGTFTPRYTVVKF